MSGEASLVIDLWDRGDSYTERERDTIPRDHLVIGLWEAGTSYSGNSSSEAAFA